MIKLLKAKIAARETTKARLQKDIPMINELIKNARENGKYSQAARTMLEKAGYKVEYNCISWAHLLVEIEKNEKELMKIAKDAGVEIVDVQ